MHALEPLLHGLLLKNRVQGRSRFVQQQEPLLNFWNSSKNHTFLSVLGL